MVAASGLWAEVLVLAGALIKRYSGNEPELLKQLFYQSLLAVFRISEVRAQLRVAGLFGLRVSTIDDRHLVIERRL